MSTSVSPSAGDADLDLDALLGAARRAAAAGAEVVLAAFGAARNVREKGPGDWVSDADTASERAVRESLEAAAPGLAFFGEEGGGERAEVGWFVDPLDGTANFVHGFPFVGVSVALVGGGRAGRGRRARADARATSTPPGAAGRVPNGEPVTVSSRAAGAGHLRHRDFRSGAKRERLREYLPVFDRALNRFEDLRRVGAASIDLAWTAAGVFDGYFEQNLGTWDVAAGAVHRARGGRRGHRLARRRARLARRPATSSPRRRRCTRRSST